MSYPELAERIRASAIALGYTACGFTTTAPFPEQAEAIRRLQNRFPEAASLYTDFLHRIDPRSQAPWAKTLVVAIRPYGHYLLPPRIIGHIGRNYLCDRRTPQHPDHDLPRRMTEALRALGLRVKRGSGVSDRWAAARAGVARLARNTFAVTPAEGSWINIECWRIDAEIPPDVPTLEDPCPPGCARCLEACPTQALCEPRCMRMDRCVAWLTYRAPWPIAPALWDRMGPWIYGCDICQDVCPLNRGRWRNLRPMPWLDALGDLLTPEGLAEMSDADYRARLYPFFWYIPNDQAERWRAHARRAIAWKRSIATSEITRPTMGRAFLTSPSLSPPPS